MITKYIKSFSKDAFYFGASSVISRLVGFLLIPIFTKFLSPEDYGIMTLLGFYTLFYSPISHLGLQGAMFRFVGFSKSIKNQNEYLKTALISTIFISIILSTLAFFSIEKISILLFQNKNFENLILLTIVSSFFMSISQMFYSFLRVNRKVKLIFNLSVANLIFSVLLNIYLIVYLKLGLTGAIYAILSSSLFSFCLVCFFVNIKWNLKIKIDKLIEMAKYGLPNVPSYLQQICMVSFGQYFLGRFYSAESLGLYAIAWKFCLPLQLMMSIMNNAWKAFKFDLYKRNKDDSNLIFSYFPIMLIFIYSIIFLIIALWGGEFLILFTEIRYHSASKYVAILALIPLFNAMYLSFGSYVAFGKTQRLQPLIAFFGLSITVVLSLILIPNYSILGVGISTASGWLLMTVGAYFYGQSLFKVDFKIIKLTIYIFSTVVLGLLGSYFLENNFIKIPFLILNLLLFIILFNGKKFINHLNLIEK